MQNAEEKRERGERPKSADEIDIHIALKDVKHKLVIMSGKGGVGKSTVAANLAVALSMRGHTVGILDCDIHGPTIPKLLGVEGKRPVVTGAGVEPIPVAPRIKVMSIGFLLSDNDSPVIWRGPLKMMAIKQFLGEVKWGELDYLIIDLPPGTGDEPLSIAQLLPGPDGALIVTTPQDVALLSVRKSINFARALNLPVIGLIENMSGLTCPHCGKRVDVFKTGGGMRACMDLTVPFLGCIPLDPMITDTGDAGRPFVTESMSSPTVKAFEEIARRVEELVGGAQKEEGGEEGKVEGGKGSEDGPNK
ncbi:MAG: Mrp/NBP35 family ATP-binding protein [Thermoplasmata archaeon]